MKDKNPGNPDSSPESIRKALKQVLDTAQWSWLLPHQNRGAVILVAAGLDLLEVAFKVATDDKLTIQSWIDGQQLARATEEQLEAWKDISDKPFAVIVVQPYVLAQEKALH